MQVERSALLKETGNQRFKSGEYSAAIDLYAAALEAATPSTPVELKRIILSNRSQTYLLHGDMYTALRDVQLALSTEYTLPESPKPLTLKCYFRHARILYTLARYTEALAQIEQYRQLSADGDYGSESKILALDDLISKAVSATEGSNVRLKVELVRAVNSRGIVVMNDFWPLVEGDADPYELERLSFNTRDRQVNLNLDDPNKTPLIFPVFVSAPFSQYDPNHDRQIFSSTQSMLESKTMASMLQGLFTSIAGASAGGSEEILMSGIIHQYKSTILICTARGRILEIPPETKLAEVFADAKWPRNGPLGLRDLRRRPRKRNFEVDGVRFGERGVEVYVIPNDDLAIFLRSLEQCFAVCGTE